MFTGIVERTIKVLAVSDITSGRRIMLENPWTDVLQGQSIAINGCCLTVAGMEAGRLQFDAIRETLDKTNLGLLQASELVNVERSLRIGDRLDGHFVQGHVDGRATLLAIQKNPQETRLSIRCPHELSKYLIPKGSVTLDGVSLTLAAVRDEIFEVAMIPTTLSLTTLDKKDVGWEFNLEADMLNKTVISWLERQKVN